ncbi:MAG: ribonuclease toxin HepT-like protein [Desulfomonilaceae bacterium]
MADENRIAVFLGEFDYQVKEIDRIYEVLQSRTSEVPKRPMLDEVIESIGYWLHNLYCAYEDLFKIVCSFWENNMSSASGYHTSLLKRMVFGIEGIRPALLSDDSFRVLDELRAFRHVFRHAYSHGLEEERVMILLNRIKSSNPIIKKDLASFRQAVVSIT